MTGPKQTYARMEFLFENKEAQTTQRMLLASLGAEIKNGTAPCMRPTRIVKNNMTTLKKNGIQQLKRGIEK